MYDKYSEFVAPNSDISHTKTTDNVPSVYWFSYIYTVILEGKLRKARSLTCIVVIIFNTIT